MCVQGGEREKLRNILCTYVHTKAQRTRTQTFSWADTQSEETWFWCVCKEVRFCRAMLEGANKCGSLCRRWYLPPLGHRHIKGRPQDIDLYSFGSEIGETATNHISVSVLRLSVFYYVSLTFSQFSFYLPPGNVPPFELSCCASFFAVL